MEYILERVDLSYASIPETWLTWDDMKVAAIFKTIDEQWLTWYYQMSIDSDLVFNEYWIDIQAIYAQLPQEINE
jgi:hypothetical protein